MSLTCKRSLWNVNNVICIGICRKALNSQPTFIMRIVLSHLKLNVYINDIDIRMPFKQHNTRNILSQIFWDFVAFIGSGQQHANVRSTFKNAMIFSSVNISVIIIIIILKTGLLEIENNALITIRTRLYNVSLRIRGKKNHTMYIMLV